MTTEFTVLQEERLDIDKLCSRDLSNDDLSNGDLSNDDLPNNNLIFRYKFSAEFVEQLLSFAKLHQYDNRHVYKEEWARWIDNNDTIVDTECTRLKNLGYDGNILDKMYKSSRYYFRNKTSYDTKTRRKYISIDPDIIYAIDEHINVNYYLPGYKPSIAYEQFCMEYESLLDEETERLLQENIINSDIQDKFKKTYKNRYYLFKQTNQERQDDYNNTTPPPTKRKEKYEIRNNTTN